MHHTAMKRVGLAVALGLLSGGAQAQAGIGVDPGTLDGTIGHNKGSVGAVQCPVGTVLTGVRHVDKAAGGTSTTVGMTSQLGLFCSYVGTDGTTVTLTPTTTGSTPEVPGFAYPFPGTTQVVKCPAGQIVQQMGGQDRTTATFPWVSQVQPLCRPLQLSADDWVGIDTASAGTALPAGVAEDNAPHTFRGYFCPNSADAAISGYHRQSGGEGYDGINIYCGKLTQARFSAVMTFSDFAWSRTLGGTGWRVDLRRSFTILDDTASNDGADRTPHASVASNINQFQSAQEIYVVPGSGYWATVSQMPESIVGDEFVESGSCADGNVSLANLQDGSCTLNIDGLPDIAVSLAAPASNFTAYGQAQNLTLTAQNRGPGRVAAADGFRIVVTLPTHWSFAAGLPAGCSTADGRIATCTLATTLSASTAPGTGGGSVSFALPVRASAPASLGNHTVTASLDTGIPHADADLDNDDYNDGNDNASAVVRLQTGTTLTVAKRWVNAVPLHAVTVSVTGTPSPVGGAALASVANTANETDTGAVPYGVVAGNSYQITEAFTAGAPEGYVRNLECTGNTGAGAALGYAPNFLVGVLTVGATATSITCTFTNSPAATRIRLQAALPDGRVLAGDQFTLSMSGAGAPGAVTTTGSGTTVTGAVMHETATPDTGYTLTQSAAGTTVSSHYLTTYACTNARPGGQTPGGSGGSFTITPAIGDDLTCTFSNELRRADVSIVKTASAATVQAGQQVEFTLQIDNAGPAAADGARIQDPAAPGLECGTVTCAASGSAACPASPTVAQLQVQGLSIPALPAGGRVRVQVFCTVTASGLP